MAAGLSLGTEQFSHANELDQDIVELTNDLTMVRGAHTFTLRHAQRVLQVPESVHPRQLRHLRVREPRHLRCRQRAAVRLQLLADRRPATCGEVPVLSVRLLRRRSVAVAAELHADLRCPLGQAVLPGQANRQSCSRSRPTATPPTSCQRPQSWSPRVGFNWDLTKRHDAAAGPRRLRPLQWPHAVCVAVEPVRQHGHRVPAPAGLAVRRDEQHPVRARPGQSADERRHARRPTRSTSSIPTIDFPMITRGNLAYDRSLPLGPDGNVELLFANDVKDIAYRNLNLVQTATREDGRPVFGRVNPTFGDVILLEQLDRGQELEHRDKSRQAVPRRLVRERFVSYGQAKSINDGTNSQARSTWINVYTAGDINNPPLAISNYDVGHRIVLTGSYLFDRPRRRCDALDVLQRPDRPALLVQLRHRCQSRRRVDQRPALLPARGRRRRSRNGHLSGARRLSSMPAIARTSHLARS